MSEGKILKVDDLEEQNPLVTLKEDIQRIVHLQKELTDFQFENSRMVETALSTRRAVEKHIQQDSRVDAQNKDFYVKNLYHYLNQYPESSLEGSVNTIIARMTVADAILRTLNQKKKALKTAIEELLLEIFESMPQRKEPMHPILRTVKETLENELMILKDKETANLHVKSLDDILAFIEQELPATQQETKH